MATERDRGGDRGVSGGWGGAGPWQPRPDPWRGRCDGDWRWLECSRVRGSGRSPAASIAPPRRRRGPGCSLTAVTGGQRSKVAARKRASAASLRTVPVPCVLMWSTSPRAPAGVGQGHAGGQSGAAAVGVRCGHVVGVVREPYPTAGPGPGPGGRVRAPTVPGPGCRCPRPARIRPGRRRTVDRPDPGRPTAWTGHPLGEGHGGEPVAHRVGAAGEDDVQGARAHQITGDAQRGGSDAQPAAGAKLVPWAPRSRATSVPGCSAASGQSGRGDGSGTIRRQFRHGFRQGFHARTARADDHADASGVPGSGVQGGVGQSLSGPRRRSSVPDGPSGGTNRRPRRASPSKPGRRRRRPRAGPRVWGAASRGNARAQGPPGGLDADAAAVTRPRPVTATSEEGISAIRGRGMDRSGCGGRVGGRGVGDGRGPWFAPRGGLEGRCGSTNVVSLSRLPSPVKVLVRLVRDDDRQFRQRQRVQTPASRTSPRNEIRGVDAELLTSNSHSIAYTGNASCSVGPRTPGGASPYNNPDRVCDRASCVSVAESGRKTPARPPSRPRTRPSTWGDGPGTAPGGGPMFTRKYATTGHRAHPTAVGA